jgi:phosphate uptake regulator
MQRRLVKQGNGALTVSLPKKWLDLNSLNAGNEVEIEEEGYKLTIRGRGIPKSNSIEVKIPHFEKTKERGMTNIEYSMVRSIIGNAYKKGYDIIIVKFENEETLRYIERYIDNLLGHEIIEINKNYVVVKNVSLELEEEYSNLFRKSFYLLQRNMKQILEMSKEKKYNLYEEIEERNFSIAKYTDYCKRILSKNKRGEDSTIFEYLFVWNFEKISIEWTLLAKYISKNKNKLSKEEIDAMEKNIEMIEGMVGNFFTGKVEYLKEYAKLKERFLYGDYELLMIDKKNDPNIIARLGMIARRCSDMVGPFYGKWI